MIRFAACVMIFAGCSLAGVLKASSYRRRTEELENVIELIKLLDMDITYRRDSLAKIFARMPAVKQCWFSAVAARCGELMREQISLEDSWSRALGEYAEGCPLNAKELEVLRDLFMGLGRSDVRGQKSYITPALTRLSSCLEEAKEQEKKTGRMYRGLGVASGVVIAIFLI